MIKTAIIAPIVVILLAGFMLQLTDVAKEASAKVLNFTDDMNGALDCAFDSRSIYECSPDLPSYDFEGDLEDYKDINEEFIIDLREEINKSGVDPLKIKIIIE